MKRSGRKTVLALSAAAVMMLAQTTSAFAAKYDNMDRFPLESPWTGQWETSDGRTISVLAADSDYVYTEIKSYSEDGWNEWIEIMSLYKDNKKRAETLTTSENSDHSASYRISGGKLIVDDETFTGGTYEKSDNALVWKQSAAGTWFYYGKDGKIAANTYTSMDGWVLNDDGSWNVHAGGQTPRPGRYVSQWDYESEIGQLIYEISMFTDLSEEDTYLKDENARVAIGVADFTCLAQDQSVLYTKEGLNIWNSMDGLYFEDANGEIFAFANVAAEGGELLMVQSYGSETWTGLYATEYYDDYGVPEEEYQYDDGTPLNFEDGWYHGELRVSESSKNKNSVVFDIVETAFVTENNRWRFGDYEPIKGLDDGYDYEILTLNDGEAFPFMCFKNECRFGAMIDDAVIAKEVTGDEFVDYVIKRTKNSADSYVPVKYRLDDYGCISELEEEYTG